MDTLRGLMYGLIIAGCIAQIIALGYSVGPDSGLIVLPIIVVVLIILFITIDWAERG
jgi:hypothetical protein